MFKPFYLFIGRRYTQVRGKNHFISFMSLTSTIGIALGVMVLITVLSVMNGFSREIRSKMLSGAAHVTIGSVGRPLANWQAVLESLSDFETITGKAPFVDGKGMLTTQGTVSAVMVYGVLPEQTNTVFPLVDNMLYGSLDSLKAGGYNIFLSERLSYSLGLRLGDKVTLVVPEANISPAGMVPRLKRFTVSGIFSINPILDQSTVFIQMNDAQKIFRMPEGISGIQIKLKDELKARRLTQQIYEHLLKMQTELGQSQPFYVNDWIGQYGPFFTAIQMEKTVMFCILLLIVLIAAFNLVSSLVMIVTDKRADIAILRTLGAKPREIMGIFLAQGSIIGTIGTSIGLVLGLLLAYYVRPITDYIQSLLGVQFLSEDVYLISYIPSEIHTKDVVGVVLVALFLSFVAALYPAWRAAKVKPAEALRYD